MRFDFSNVPAVQENQDGLFTRWRDLYKAGGCDLFTLQSKTGLSLQSIMLPQSPAHGILGLSSDLPPVGTNPWLELYQLAERAGVSVEYLCTSVEIAALHINEGKSASASFAPPLYDDALEEVAHILADDGFEFEVKDWREWEHPRDEQGRFADGGGAYMPELPGNPYDLHAAAVEPDKSVIKKVRDELLAINKHLAQHLNLKSRWSENLSFSGPPFFRADGKKRWTCSIVLSHNLVAHIHNPEHGDHKRYEVHRFSVLIHELLHGVAPTQKEEYLLASGWEEGVVENVTRIHQQGISDALGLGFSPANFRMRNDNHPYNDLVDALETIRKILQVKEQGKRQFYEDLLALPANKKEAKILSLWNNLPPEARERFGKKFDEQRRILNSHNADPLAQGGASLTTKTSTNSMNRQEVIHTVLSARTPEQITHAFAVVDEWMDEHPDDMGVRGSCETLEMLAEAHGMFDYDDHLTYIDCQDESFDTEPTIDT